VAGCPAQSDGSWWCCCRGAHPLEELEAALLRIAVNPPESLLGQLREDERGLARAVKRVLPPTWRLELLLVIDQFEEVVDAHPKMRPIAPTSLPACAPRCSTRTAGCAW